MGAQCGREKFKLLPLLWFGTEGKGRDREEGMKAISTVTGLGVQ